MLYSNGVPVQKIMVELTHAAACDWQLTLVSTTEQIAPGGSGKFTTLFSNRVDLGLDPVAGRTFEPDLWDREEMMHALAYAIGAGEYRHVSQGNGCSFVLEPGTRINPPGWFVVSLEMGNDGRTLLHITEEDDEDPEPWRFKSSPLAAAVVAIMEALMELRPGYELTNATPGSDDLVRLRYTRIEEATAQVA